MMINRNITFFGECKSSNLGDPVICYIASELFKEAIEGGEFIIHDISFLNNNKSKFYYNIRRILFILRIKTKILDSIFIFIHLWFLVKYKSTICYVGGALLQDFFMDHILATLFVAKIKRCKVAFLSLGFGPLSLNHTKKLKQRLNGFNDVVLSVRDNTDLFKTFIDTRVSWSPDIAVLTCLYYKCTTTRVNNLVGIGCIDVNRYNENYPEKHISKKQYVRNMKELVFRMHSAGYMVELFCNGDINDFSVAQEIYLETNDCCTLSDRPVSHFSLVDSINRYSCVISSRLHSLIMSYSLGIPFIGLEWDKKVQEFADSIGVGSHIFKMNSISLIDKNTIDGCMNITCDPTLRDYHRFIIFDRVREIVS